MVTDFEGSGAYSTLLSKSHDNESIYYNLGTLFLGSNFNSLNTNNTSSLSLITEEGISAPLFIGHLQGNVTGNYVITDNITCLNLTSNIIDTNILNGNIITTDKLEANIFTTNTLTSNTITSNMIYTYDISINNSLKTIIFGPKTLLFQQGSPDNSYIQKQWNLAFDISGNNIITQNGRLTIKQKSLI